ncbi:YMGG-like glycine zipper-containing protein [Arcticibacter sp. MXS-1]|uniref:YMGG-like glycine zipper-containing protein n=1 Tax=Arcticibacter sp. MXS-1 TaxID=3341726 RepID=UPI0035A8E1D4
MKALISMLAFATVLAACNNNAKTTNTQAYKDSIKKAVQDSIKLDSFQRAEVQAKEKARIDSLAEVKAAKKAAAEKASARSYASRRSSSSRTVHPVVQSDYYEQTQPQKKGWSSAAKGAAIGAGAGAVTGLIVDKKNARGAIIGGVVGAGTGYVIGRQHDKKTGRAQ